MVQGGQDARVFLNLNSFLNPRNLLIFNDLRERGAQPRNSLKLNELSNVEHISIPVIAQVIMSINSFVPFFNSNFPID